jgi:hypothetical protein
MKLIELLKKFFLNYIWIGLVLVLISIILDLSNCYKTIFLNVVIELLLTIGIAIMIAAIFTFASSTSEFIEKIRSFLEDLIIKRNFLGNIDAKSKKIALRSILAPSDKEKSIYSPIEEYYNFYVSETLSIGQRNVRSNFNINSLAKFNSTTNRIEIEMLIFYRLYPSVDGYSDINFCFEDIESKGLYVRITDSDGKVEEINTDKLKNYDGKYDKKNASIPLSHYNNKHGYLDIELKVIEYGSDQWALASFKVLLPTNGLSFSLNCYDDILINKYEKYIIGPKYFEEKSLDQKNYFFSCKQWLSPGTGLAIIVFRMTKNQ